MSTFLAPPVRFGVPHLKLINDKNKGKHYDHVYCSACAVWRATLQAY